MTNNTWLKSVIAAAEEAETQVEAGQTFSDQVPKTLRDKIDEWQFGKYGWTSPVNLMLTAAWMKWLNPSQDVCKIWAKDANNSPISGAYSLRTYDESVTVPVICRLDISTNFCSSNSGMQGTRAIEKTRVATRLNRNTTLDQRVLFDLNLLVQIMNDIDELTPDEAKYVFQYFIELGCNIRKKRYADLMSLSKAGQKKGASVFRLVLKSAARIQDPQFTKILAASCIERFASHTDMFSDCVMAGVYDKKTGANARSSAPGDFWLLRDEVAVLGCEVKDPSKQFGFEILSAVRDRSLAHPGMNHYWLVTASNAALKNEVIGDARWEKQLAQLAENGCEVIAITLRDLLAILGSLEALDHRLTNLISTHLTKMTDLKNDTVTDWMELLKED